MRLYASRSVLQGIFIGYWLRINPWNLKSSTQCPPWTTHGGCRAVVICPPESSNRFSITCGWGGSRLRTKIGSTISWRCFCRFCSSRLCTYNKLARKLLNLLRALEPSGRKWQKSYWHPHPELRWTGLDILLALSATYTSHSPLARLPCT